MAIGYITVDGKPIGVIKATINGVDQGEAEAMPSADPAFEPDGIGFGAIGNGAMPHGSSAVPHGTELASREQGKPATTSTSAPVRGVPFAQGSSATDKAIVQASRAHGLNPNTMRSIASIESGMNPNSNANRRTQYKGLFQIGHDEWAHYGHGGNIYSAQDNADAAAQMLADHRDWFRARYGRKPTDAELYMMHQQGRGFFTRGAMTNIGGNPYPGMRGPQTHESFEAGWGREVERRKALFAKAHPDTDVAATKPTDSTSQ